MVLLTIDPARLRSPVQVEGGYPHIYGPLDLDAVIAVEPFSCS